MDSADGSIRLQRAGVLILSLAILLGLFVASDGARIITGLVEGRWMPEAARYLDIHRSLDPDVRTTAYYIEAGLPVLFRLSLALGTVGAVIAVLAGRLHRAFGEFFTETSPAQDLALLRITVFGAMLWWWFSNDLTAFAALPSALIVPPPGLSSVVDFLPVDPVPVGALSAAFALASFLAAVGLWTRPSAWVATILGLLVLGLPQFYGKIDHYHHFIWFGAVLAASRSGDAWSIDALRAPQRRDAVPARAYGFPLRVIMLLIGCFYFFAGFWKVVIGGPAWPGETLRTILHAQWMRIDYVPSLRVDLWGVWTTIGGSAVIAFELLFVFLILFRSTRIWAAAAGIVFHLAVLLTTGINFWTLLICYTVFVDTAWFRPATDGNPPVQIGGEPDGGLRRIGGALIGLAALSGVTLIDTWPVAVYPTFAGVPEPRVWTVTLEGTTSDGRLVRLRPWQSDALRKRYGNSRVGGLVSQVAWSQDTVICAVKSEALASVVVSVDPVMKDVKEVIVYRELVAVDPESWEKAAFRRDRLGTWRRSGG